MQRPALWTAFARTGTRAAVGGSSPVSRAGRERILQTVLVPRLGEESVVHGATLNSARQGAFERRRGACVT
jgi:hypothetical protein